MVQNDEARSDEERAFVLVGAKPWSNGIGRVFAPYSGTGTATVVHVTVGTRNGIRRAYVGRQVVRPS